MRWFAFSDWRRLVWTVVLLGILTDGRSLRVSVNGIGEFDENWPSIAQVLIAVREPTHPALAVAAGQPEDRILSTNFFFGPGERIQQVVSEGRHLHSREMRALQMEVAANPARGDAEIGAALAKAGARYGPDQEEALRRNVNLECFQPLFGTVRRSDTRFIIGRRPVDPNAANTVLVSWGILLETQEKTSQRSCYLLAFEPFDGRLLSLSHEAGACKSR